MGRREGKQDKKGGGRGKKGMRGVGVGEERRREGEQGEMRGSFAPTAVFKVGAYGALQAHRSVPGPRRRPWPCVMSALCQR